MTAIQWALTLSVVISLVTSFLLLFVFALAKALWDVQIDVARLEAALVRHGIPTGPHRR